VMMAEWYNHEVIILLAHAHPLSDVM